MPPSSVLSVIWVVGSAVMRVHRVATAKRCACIDEGGIRGERDTHPMHADARFLGRDARLMHARFPSRSGLSALLMHAWCTGTF